ncbi:flagellar hook protein FlgE [Pantoea agglomerans]|jgi:flagellar hook protein FlgE|uniref:flagellar hook protein FlgE n=1 Tax=Enterobacter agglomerans TaxID=549 RepID=UPI001009463C|nr:flagellar hook protein FlgE [Pantoea agglomerans]QAV47648.1 flagellar hook protein FlgE [Pantoea agglomerans]QAV52304.1 flagellar hook protein FlgE [Pantoea agglomerans]
MSFSQAVSGLNAASSNLDVIGNNIANSATAGFKASTAAFADVFAGSGVGLGTKVAAVIQNFTDGNTTTTSRGLDVAISNDGFFRLQDNAGNTYYSRNGQFTLTSDRKIVNTSGMALTGYPVAGTPPVVQTGANPVELTVPSTAMSANPTSTGALQANLNSSYNVPTVTPFDTANVDSYSDKTSMSVYDSLGNTHQLDLYFVKTGDNAWTLHPVDSTTGTASPATNLTFTSSGILNGTGNVTVDIGALNGSAANQTMQLSLLGSKQQNTGAKSTFGNPSQDGYAPGELTSYVINNDGTISGSYSNQKTQLLGQIALANFSNAEGLKSEGNNVWSATAASGQALVGLAGTGNLGTLTSGALEASNVDQSKELVNMIVAQRNYQANAQTIKTQDQILNTLVNLR